MKMFLCTLPPKILTKHPFQDPSSPQVAVASSFPISPLYVSTKLSFGQDAVVASWQIWNFPSAYPLHSLSAEHKVLQNEPG